MLIFEYARRCDADLTGEDMMATAAMKLNESVDASELETARADYLQQRAIRKALCAKRDQKLLAQQMSGCPTPYPERAAIAIAAAGPEFDIARRNPRRYAIEIEAVHEEITLQFQDFEAAKIRFDAACSTEAGRILDALKPRHQAAVAGISAALVQLSAALAEEIATRDEFQKLAPAPGLMCGGLPNMSAVFMSTAFMPFWDSRASAWHREAIANGSLKTAPTK